MGVGGGGLFLFLFSRKGLICAEIKLITWLVIWDTKWSKIVTTMSTNLFRDFFLLAKQDLHRQSIQNFVQSNVNLVSLIFAIRFKCKNVQRIG